MDVKIFLFQSFFSQVSGTKKDIKHGSKVKGNTKKERTNSTDNECSREGPYSTHPLCQSKYHCYIAYCYIEIFSLGVWKMLHEFMFYWVQQGGSPFHSYFFSHLFIGGPANLCDSVATECLPAAECSSPQQTSPHPSRSLARCLPADLYRLPLPPPGPPGQEQLFQNWPTCIKFTTTAPESVLSNPHFHSLCLSPAKITLARDGGA
ncbi:hypothetical protein JOB18_036949 [Solea senegalensis]|uniref:Uncharacterized protein n=1 Tax=Solea senegalensis TaxID=28829 RepID=A0AAV6PBU0_SOLSE|nr:hypothetical protein JOB18_036949 [Solea senegalensis]